MYRLILICLILLTFACSQTGIHPDNFIWTPQESGTEAHFRGVCTVTKDVAWVSGSQSTVLRTIDGGLTWEKKTVPDAEGIDFRDIQAFDAETALILSAGQPARVYKTTDGGETWRNTYTDPHPQSFYNAMAFWSRSQGIATSDPVDGAFLLIKTADGGETWTRVPPESLPAPLEGEAGFAASGTCIAIQGEGNVWFGQGGPAARVFKSNDWGKSWAVVESPLLHGMPSAGVFSVNFKDAKNGIIVGGNYRDEPAAIKNAAITSDGGATWILIEESPPSGFRECTAYVSGTKPPLMIAVGPSGSDYSIDEGKTWSVADTTKGMHAISFATRHAIGWAVGANGLILKIAQ